MSAFVFLLNSLRRHRPQCLVAHGIQEQVLAWGLYRVLGIPYVVHVHEVFEPHEVHGFSRLLLRAEGPALRKAAFLIFPEKERARIYRERYSLTNRIHIVYNCPRLAQPGSSPRRDLRRDHAIPADHLIVGYMGGIGNANAILELVQALPLVPKVTLLLWGWANTEYRNEIERTALAQGLSSRVRLLGQVEDKWGHLAGCDVLYCVYRDNLLRTRHQATASNKFTEALGVGVPVLAWKMGGFAEALAQTHAGLAVDDLSPQALAQALRQLSDPSLRQQLGTSARKAFQAEYHYERQFRPVVEAFRSFASASNPLNSKSKRVAASL